MAPTRELALQIYDHSLEFSKCMGLDLVCIYGGGGNSRHQQSEVAKGVDVLVATPGRLHDFVQSKRLDLSEVFIFVLDEADRMLDMGFLPQVKSIVLHLREERQTLLWSATWPPEVDELSRDLCKNRPITIQVGDQGLTINTAITQHVKVISDRDKKKEMFKILRANSNTPDFKVLIFSSTKKNCDFLAELLCKDGYQALALHGDKDQSQREKIIEDFRNKANILVATDVASRGLDIKNIKAVINFDFPGCIEDYIHRIGRTGRAGATGSSYTFITEKDAGHAQELCEVACCHEGVEEGQPDRA
jgi:ATP-dependent RNA helicase DDX5/DBP2